MYTSGRPLRSAVECPTNAELQAWYDEFGDDPALVSIPAICTDNLGLFLFLKYCATNGDEGAALFVEGALRVRVRSVFLLFPPLARPRHLFLASNATCRALHTLEHARLSLSLSLPTHTHPPIHPPSCVTPYLAGFSSTREKSLSVRARLRSPPCIRT